MPDATQKHRDLVTGRTPSGPSGIGVGGARIRSAGGLWLALVHRPISAPALALGLVRASRLATSIQAPAWKLPQVLNSGEVRRWVGGVLGGA